MVDDEISVYILQHGTILHNQTEFNPVGALGSEYAISNEAPCWWLKVTELLGDTLNPEGMAFGSLAWPISMLPSSFGDSLEH
jgi:hypothetical protein